MNLTQIQKIYKKSAFTLVELIIVITILSILGVIAFISFKNYSINARDGNRISTLKNIEIGLILYSAKTGNYPQPEDQVEIIGTGGQILIKQGVIKTGISQAIKLNKETFDPKDHTNYIYSTNINNTKFQLGTYLENRGIIASYIPQTYANIDYNKRYFYTLGDKLGILLQEDNSPLTDISGINLEGNNNNFKVYFSNDNNEGIFTGTGELLIGKIIEQQSIGNQNNTPSAQINAICGTGAQIYEHTVNEFNTGEKIFCSIGILEGSTPIFPNQGETVNWLCKSSNGGSDATCEASKLNPSQEVKTCRGRPVNSRYYNQKESHDVVVAFGNDSPHANYNEKPSENSCDFSCDIGFTHQGGLCNDITPPISGNFTINNNASSTNTTNVTLNITCPTDVSNPIQVAYGNSSSPTNWQNCDSIKSHTLITGDGTKTVYMRFRDSANIPNITSDLVQTITLNTIIRGEQLYTTPGTHNWVAPSGVTKVSVVCIGGTTESYFINNITVKGGAPNGLIGGGFVGDGGGNGGNAGTYAQNSPGYIDGGGGGGAGGYTGNGGNGGNGYGGGGAIHSRGGGGGGTGLYGIGTSGVGGGNGGNGQGGGGGGGGGGIHNGSSGINGTSGSSGNAPGGFNGGKYGGGAGSLSTEGAGGGGGLGWKNNITVVPGNTYSVVVGAAGTVTNAGMHGGGACRIVWPGNTRQFPNTDVGA